MRSYSIYRGYAGKATLRYLWVSPEIAGETTLLNALEPWLTLDFKAVHRIENREFQEAWCCCTMPGFLVVARLMRDAAELSFSHARVWAEPEIPVDWDPGSLMGMSREFDSPGGEMRGPSQQSLEMPWQDLIDSERDQCGNFISHLFEARVSGRPLIIGADEYPAGNKLARRLAFARSALPRELRRDCRIRIYTRGAEGFLKRLQAGVLVVPIDELRALRAIEDRATFLFPDGTLMHGPKTDGAWGRMIALRTRAFPNSLFRFANRAKKGMTVDQARVAFNLSAAFGSVELMDDLLKEKLVSGEFPADFVEAAEWSQFSTGALGKLATRKTANPAEEAFLDGIHTELRRRKVTLDPETQLLWAAGMGSVYDLALLTQRGLLSPQVAGDLALKLKPNEFVDWLAIPVLDAALISVTREATLPAVWTDALAKDSRAWIILSGLLRIALPANWESLLWDVFQELLEANRLPKEGEILFTGIAPKLALARLLLAELYHRCRWAGAAKRLTAVTEITNREQRRWVMQQRGVAPFTCLDQFKVQVGWKQDVDDLGGSPVVARVIDLFKRTGGSALSPSLQKELDAEMESDMSVTTRGLLAAHLWKHWRRNSKLAAPRLKACAINWMLDTEGPHVWDEWKQVIVDLTHHRIEASELKGFFIIKNPPWPVFQDKAAEQRRDLWGVLTAPAREALEQIDDSYKELRIAAVQPAVQPKDPLAGVSRRLPALLRLIMPGFPLSAALQKELDAAMEEDMRATTHGLLAAGAWMSWRRNSKLPPKRLKASCVNWLLDTDGPHIWDEWKQVVLDLTSSRIEALELKSLFAMRSPPWPVFKEKAEEQRRDIWGVMTPDARDALELLDPAFKDLRAPAAAKPTKPPKFEKLVFPPDTPAAAKAFIDCFAAKPALAAAGIAEQGFWKQPTFQARIAAWLLSYPRLDEQALSILSENLPENPGYLDESVPLPTAAAEEYVRRGHPAIAEFLAPGTSRSSLWVRGYKALASGTPNATCWKVIAVETENALRDKRPNLLTGIAECVRKADKTHRDALDQTGWPTLKEVLRKFPVLMSAPVGPQESLPAFELAMLVRRGYSPVDVAADLIMLQEHAAADDPKWWKSLIRHLQLTSVTPGQPVPGALDATDYYRIRIATKGLSRTARANLDAAIGGRFTAITPDPADELYRTAMQRLRTGDFQDPCWLTLEHLNSFRPHPLVGLAELVAASDEALRADLAGSGWENLKGVLARHPELMGATHPAEKLPARVLAEVLRPGIAPAAIASDLVLLNPMGVHVYSDDWWKSLFLGITPEAARAMVPALDKVLNPQAREIMHRTAAAARSTGQ